MSDRAIPGVHPRQSPEGQTPAPTPTSAPPSIEALEAMMGTGGAPPPPAAPPQAPNAPAELAPAADDGPSGYPSMAEFEAMAAIANGRAPIPGEETSAPPPVVFAPPAAPAAPPAPATPAAQPEWMQALQAQQTAFQAQMQALFQIVATQQQAPAPAAPQPSFEDQSQQIAAEMRMARLDPTNEHHVLNYRLWRQQQQREQEWEQRFAEQENRWQSLYAQAHQVSVRDSVGSAVEANLRPFASVPEATKRSIHDIATLYAQQGMAPEKAVETALAGIMPLLRQPQAGPTPAATSIPVQPTAVPAFAGLSPGEADARMRAMSAVTVPGRTAGRASKIPSLDELEGLITRGARVNGRLVRS